jgi:predicted methyltransferase
MIARLFSRHSAAVTAAIFLGMLGCGTGHAQTADYAAILSAPDRSDADRQADQRRDPTPLLVLSGVKPGMKVLDMGAGGGYSTELMARAVAPNGTVYGQNPPDVSDKAKAAFQARQEKPAGKNIVTDMAPFDDPVPAGVSGLDLVTFLFYYHDTAYMTVDRAAMNGKLFAALKPGGILIVADHGALPGQGLSVVKTLHRIEESTERQEIESAGFKFVAEGNFWRSAADTHDFPSYKPTVPVDNFVLKFQKPN